LRLTVTVADPELLPAQFASEIAVTVYVVVTDGLTVLVAGLTVMPLWETPSDQVTLHGAVPVNAAWICAEPPGLIAPPPDTVAVGVDWMGSVRDTDVDPQPLDSVTVTITFPDAPAVNVIAAFAALDVIAPPEIDHEYVSVLSFGTEAAFPAEFEHT